MNDRKLAGRDRNLFFALAIFAITGWVAAAAIATTVGGFKLSAVRAEADAKTWKRQAGKAYTEMLQARGNAKSTASVLIPAGARIDCTVQTSEVDGRIVNKCDRGTIYPPSNY